MGCIWSSGDRDRCLYCCRRPVNNIILIDNVCEICIDLNSRPRPPTSSYQLKPRFGEYRCSSCGRYWTSRLSWARTYQVCKRCRTQVYAHNQRDLRPEDRSKEKNQEHQKEYCQMCLQLGYYCGNYGKPVRRRRYGK